MTPSSDVMHLMTSSTNLPSQGKFTEAQDEFRCTTNVCG